MLMCTNSSFHLHLLESMNRCVVVCWVYDALASYPLRTNEIAAVRNDDPYRGADLRTHTLGVVGECFYRFLVRYEMPHAFVLTILEELVH